VISENEVADAVENAIADEDD